jgi:membrane associated rhomboid family serine protease
MSSFQRFRPAGSYYRPSFFGGFRFFPPVIKWLIIVNVGVWLAFDVILAPFTIGRVPIFEVLAGYLALWPLGTHFYPWQLFTYMFIHGGFWHLLLNMLALWMFGMELEHLWGSKRFLFYYLLCGLGGGVTNLLAAQLLGQAAPTVGASGAVFGILVAFGILFPDRPIYLYFLLPIRAKFFVLLYIGLELFSGVTGTADGIAHFAHLGGAATGIIYLLAVMKVQIFRQKPRVEVGGTSGPFNQERYSPTGDRIQEARFYDIRTGKPPADEAEVTQEVIDAILDKIGRAGYQSLSDDEKRILNEASKKIH